MRDSQSPEELLDERREKLKKQIRTLLKTGNSESYIKGYYHDKPKILITEIVRELEGSWSPVKNPWVNKGETDVKK